MPSFDELIDNIYEAAVVPELWPHVLERMTKIGNGLGTLMFTTDGSAMRAITSPAIAGDIDEYVAQG
jgi:hypothetical protein